MSGRIPQSFVDELLDRVDIVELIDSRLKLKKSGKNYMACCPFHDEKSPSFSVNAEKQFYHCFGCGASGNAVGFLMEFEHRSFPDVVEQLAQQCGLEVPRDENFDAAQQKQRQDIYTTLEKAARYYQEQLRSHAQANIARDYLKGRGLTGMVAQQFGIGYALPGWDNLLRFAGTDEASRILLSRAGLLVEKERDEAAQTKEKTYDRFRHRIMFPIRDVRGRVIGFGGRVLNDDKPKYLNSPETEVFHKGRELYGLYEALQANRHLERVLVVEGYMDVVALAQFGITFATATLGTAASEDHLDKAFRHAPEVVFCFDGDEAGTRAARRALDVALPTLSDGRQVRFLFLPDDEDPDTLVRKLGKEDFLQRLQQAMPLSEFLFQVAGEQLNLASPEGRAGLITRLVPMLRRVPEGAYKLQLVNLLAQRGQTETSAIQALLSQSTPFDNVYPERSRGAQGATYSRSLSGVEGNINGVEASGQKTKWAERKAEGRRCTALTMRKLNLWDEATAMLLQQPTLLHHLEEDHRNALEVFPESTRLLRLTTLLRERPDMSLNKTLGLWQSLYGAEESQVLYQLAAREPLLDEAALAKHFVDVLGRLQLQVREGNAQFLINKARTQGLSEGEKAELNRLLKGG
jgi:DNA primase